MQLSYDPRYNIAYLRFQPKRGEVEAIKLSDKIIVDLAADGQIYGIELLNANKQLKGEDMVKFLFLNEATGEKAEFEL
ncbi:DUF2283 domain-containing protein [candidate division KSB1 bacterium]|nr:DUF2283 domain-containing protein [candidate division KSB1 bacterium]